MDAIKIAILRRRVATFTAIASRLGRQRRQGKSFSHGLSQADSLDHVFDGPLACWIGRSRHHLAGCIRCWFRGIPSLRRRGLAHFSVFPQNAPQGRPIRGGQRAACRGNAGGRDATFVGREIGGSPGSDQGSEEVKKVTSSEDEQLRHAHRVTNHDFCWRSRVFRVSNSLLYLPPISRMDSIHSRITFPSVVT